MYDSVHEENPFLLGVQLMTKRIAYIIGPSKSGKTTAANNICQLQKDCYHLEGDKFFEHVHEGAFNTTLDEFSGNGEYGEWWDVDTWRRLESLNSVKLACEFRHGLESFDKSTNFVSYDKLVIECCMLAVKEVRELFEKEFLKYVRSKGGEDICVESRVFYLRVPDVVLGYQLNKPEINVGRHQEYIERYVRGYPVYLVHYDTIGVDARSYLREGERDGV